MRAKLTMHAAAGCLAAALILPGAAAAHGTHLKAKMSGDQVVGGEGAREHALGHVAEGRARLHLLKGKGKVCFKVSWEGVGNYKGLMIGVYKGAAGENGPLKITLVEGEQRNPWAEGCVQGIPSTRVKRLGRHPENYHVNVKTKKYPRYGAIRGQLRAVQQ